MTRSAQTTGRLVSLAGASQAAHLELVAPGLNGSQTNLATLPVHGQQGRVAAVRRAFGLRQVDFARELRRCGGRTSRETVSHWENLRDDGTPRSRLTRRNAAAVALLVREQLGLEVTDEFFFEPQETPWGAVERRQLEISAQLTELTRIVSRIDDRLRQLER